MGEEYCTYCGKIIGPFHDCNSENVNINGYCSYCGDGRQLTFSGWSYCERCEAAKREAREQESKERASIIVDEERKSNIPDRDIPERNIVDEERKSNIPDRDIPDYINQPSRSETDVPRYFESGTVEGNVFEHCIFICLCFPVIIIVFAYEFFRFKFFTRDHKIDPIVSRQPEIVAAVPVTRIHCCGCTYHIFFKAAATFWSVTFCLFVALVVCLCFGSKSGVMSGIFFVLFSIFMLTSIIISCVCCSPCCWSSTTLPS